MFTGMSRRMDALTIASGFCRYRPMIFTSGSLLDTTTGGVVAGFGFGGAGGNGAGATGAGVSAGGRRGGVAGFEVDERGGVGVGVVGRFVAGLGAGAGAGFVVAVRDVPDFAAAGGAGRREGTDASGSAVPR